MKFLHQRGRLRLLGAPCRLLGPKGDTYVVYCLDYDNKGNNAYFWSSTEDDSDFAYYMRLNYSLGSSFLD